MAAQFVQAPNAESARFWSVPFQRNPHFTGRDKILDRLARTLNSNDPQLRRQVVYGNRGVGKTQLALEFAHRYREQYDFVWWASAQDESALSVAYGGVVRALGGRAGIDSTLHELRMAMERELARFGRWLIVFDNAPGPDTVLEYLPAPPAAGALIITSRDPNWRGTAQPFLLDVFERMESVEFLKKRTGRGEAPIITDRLAQALRDMPLALEQAGVLIAEAGISYTHYLSRFEDHWAELLRAGRSSVEHPDTISMTWELGFRQLEQAEPAAADLLNVCAYLAPADIPRTIFRQATRELPAPLALAVQTAAGLDALVVPLLRHSLIAATDKTLSVQPLVAGLTRDRLPEEQQRHWCEIALRVMRGLIEFDEMSVESWLDQAPVVPLAISVAKYAEQLAIDPAGTAHLLNDAGSFLYQLGHYTQAKSAFERALALTVQAHGSENPRRSAIENNLGRVLNRLGDHRRAKEHFTSAIAVDQAAYGETHPHVAELANNYGISLSIAGEVEDAMQQFEWALSVVETHFGPEHPKVAHVVNNLGYSLAGLGDLDRALNHFTRALAASEEAYGPNHPVVANIRTNLGIVMSRKGRTDIAVAEFERALAIAEKVLGQHHPDVARNLTHLGILLHDQGYYPDARRHFERALAIEERVLGPHHYALITTLNSLGRCFKRMGKLDEAVACHARSAGIVRHLRENAAANAGSNNSLEALEAAAGLLG